MFKIHDLGKLFKDDSGNQRDWATMSNEMKLAYIKFNLDQVFRDFGEMNQWNASVDMRLTVVTQGMMAICRILEIDVEKFAKETASPAKNNPMLAIVAKESKKLFEEAERQERQQMEEDERIAREKEKNKSIEV